MKITIHRGKGMIVGNVETGYQKCFVTFGCRDAKFCVSTGPVFVRFLETR